MQSPEIAESWGKIAAIELFHKIYSQIFKNFFKLLVKTSNLEFGIYQLTTKTHVKGSLKSV